MAPIAPARNALTSIAIVAALVTRTRSKPAARAEATPASESSITRGGRAPKRSDANKYGAGAGFKGFKHIIPGPVMQRLRIGQDPVEIEKQGVVFSQGSWNQLGNLILFKILSNSLLADASHSPRGVMNRM